MIQFTKHSKVPGYMLKLDFEKAYDTMKWDCILEALQSWGFSCSWITWITLWLRSANVTITFNDIRGKEIICNMGLRQGDPLPPSYSYSLLMVLTT